MIPKESIHNHCLVRAATLEKLQVLLQTRSYVAIGDKQTQILAAILSPDNRLRLEVMIHGSPRTRFIHNWYPSDWIYASKKRSIACMFEEDQ
jgi:hypothetical protein